MARFQAMKAESVRMQPLTPGSFNTEMPWTTYAGMTAEDLGAIYDHLRTVPARANTVEKFTPAAAAAQVATRQGG